MQKKIKTVRPEDFKNQAWLLAGEPWFINAVENGELVLISKAHTDDEVREQVYDELMKFIKPIRQYATNEWKKDNRVDHLWRKIFESRLFCSSFIGKKGKGKDHLLQYRAIAFVIALWDKGVYLEAKGTLKGALLSHPLAVNIWKNATSNSYKLDKEKGEDKELDRIMNQI